MVHIHSVHFVGISVNCSLPRGLPPAAPPQQPQVPLWMRRSEGLSDLGAPLPSERSALYLEGRDPSCPHEGPLFTSKGVMPPPPNELHGLTLLEKLRAGPQATEVLVHIAALGGLR